MPQYIVKRILLMIPTLVALSIFIFVLTQLPPGSYLDSIVTELESQGESISQDQIESLKVRYGFDEPLYVQYLKWVSGWLRGDFGTSFTYYGQQNLEVISHFLGYTVLIAFSTQLFILVVGIAIGIFSATHQYTLGDHIATFIGFIGLSIPNFLLALILMYIGYFVFGIPALGGLFSNQYLDAPWSIGKALDLIAHLWIPVVVLGTAGTAGIARRMRGNLLDVLKMQYVATARAKGLREGVVVRKHATMNAVSPIIMAVGMRFPEILSGSTIVSIVLSLPTLGPVLYKALTNQDMYLAGTILFFQSLLLLVGNLLADIALVAVDPRVEFE